MKKLALFTILTGVALVPAHAGNIVLNPGFETGDLTSWNSTRATSNSDLAVRLGGVSPGAFDAEFGAETVGDFDTIAQSVATVNGQTYTFSFSLAEEFGGGGGGDDILSNASLSSRGIILSDPVADFQVFWNAGLVLDEPAAGRTGSFDFTQFAFDEVATGNDIITFRAYNVPSFYHLDDVSVSLTDAAGVPEPATWLVMGAGLIALAAFRRVTR
jgi:PEP-CTERM motif